MKGSVPAPPLPLSLERVGCNIHVYRFFLNYHLFQGEFCKPLYVTHHGIARNPPVRGAGRAGCPAPQPGAQPGPRGQERNRAMPSGCAAARPAMPAPPARGLPLPDRADASGLGPPLHRSPRICPHRGSAGSRQPQPCCDGRAGSWRGGRERCLGGGDGPLSIQLQRDRPG